MEPEEIRDKSYEEIRDDLPTMQRRVFASLWNDHPASNNDLARRLEVYPHQITGRVKELRDKNLVVQDGQKTDFETGKTVSTWRPAGILFPESLFDHRSRENG